MLCSFADFQSGPRRHPDGGVKWIRLCQGMSLPPERGVCRSPVAAFIQENDQNGR